ncbi:molecular chaperone DnaJ [candidate division TA06 bacterium]|uniref:Chaperone protein DnaJ n=1 Tax=candidate division TA06 bacterium TaxID=2250710 RepID=A0A523XVR7_UNCT6|nr:MAG: molecular chaperone DnaJ [candidate division TA06 bacterium]
MTKRDYYETLGISRSASKDEIKSAYRKLAKKFHPDANRDNPKASEEKFKEISEAYEILMDPEKRSRYDQFGHQGVSDAFSRGGFTWQDFTRGSDIADIFGDLGDLFGGSSIFDMFLGGGATRRTRRAAARGSDIRVHVKLKLEEIATGTRKKIRLKRYETCAKCGATGAKKGSTPITCPSCRGRGELKQVSSSIFGRVVNVTQCRQCGGEGKIITDPCPKCGGDGRVKKEKTISISIPAGVSTGNYIPLPGEGNAGRNGTPSGDLIVVVEEKEHPIFERDREHIACRVFAPFSTMALGGKVEVPTLDGSVKLKVPPGTQSGKVFRLRGKGLPRLSNYGRGDELVQVIVWTPRKLSAQEKSLLGQLEDVRTDDPPPPGKYSTRE